MDKKITILTPVYQGERFIQSYIDMVLNYDYKNLELILVNDASTDKTDEIIRNNEERIKKSGIEFKYFNLEQNMGQAGAINACLKEVTGDYLCWQDVDDIFYPNCISKSLQYCLDNPECKIVFSKYNIVNSYDLTKVVATRPKNKFKHKNLFMDYIWEKNVIFAPMRFVETEALFNVLKDKSIYPSRGGQNWQLILPVVYSYKWGYIDEVLSDYVIYANSHCHTKEAFSKTRLKLHEDLLINTIKRLNIPIVKKLYYIIVIRYKYFLKSLNSLLRISINLKQRKINVCLFGNNFSWSADEK